MSDTIRVMSVAAEVTFPLRQRILRPHETLEQLALRGDDAPDAGHFAAFDETGEVVGTATVRRTAPPWDPADDRAWRLRGMATAEGMRSRGVGGRVLAAVIDHVAANGGGLLWCNARTPAVEFYRRAGFETRGDEWLDAVIGPHVAMLRWVDPRQR